MLGKSWQLIAGAAVFAAVTAPAPAEEVGPAAVPQQSVLLLRNGEAIEGKISRVGELYYVALPSEGHGTCPREWTGGEIRVKAAEVEFCCRDLEEGYRRKRAAIQPGDVRGHLGLAQWCLRHGLLGPAGRELADALDADPTHPMIGLLERRLKMALEPPPRRLPTKATGQAASPEELDRLVRGMPPGSVETFTQTIQPLLVNHCGAAGCHGPRSESAFRLLRTPPGRPASRRLTQRNLHAAMAWVDREDPAASRLLTLPIGPHGTAKKAVFSQGQAAQYKRMVDWVCQLSRRPAPKIPETVASKEKPPVRAMPAESQGSDSPPPESSGTSDRQPAAGSGKNEPPLEGPSVKRGAPLPLFVPVDPFDPEIFNRRYFGRSEQIRRP